MGDRLAGLRSLLATFALAIALAAVALAVKLALLIGIDANAGFVIYVPAIALAAWFRGLLGGLLTMFAAATGDIFLFLEPIPAPLVEMREDQLRLAFFLIGGVSVSFLTDRLRVARDRARQDAAERRQLLKAEAGARRQLGELIEEQRRASELREAFNSIVSHELRTPITAIYAGAKLLSRRDRVLDDSTRVELAQDLEHEAERLFRLVEDMLILARTERGTIELGDEPVLLSHVAERVARSEQERWPSAQFEVRASGVVPAVRGDDTYIEQVLRNLMGNAAKYSPAGARIEVALDAADDGVRVHVLDEGVGIDPTEANRLFELYYRSPNTAKSAGGAGIGLFVCRTLIEAMGGRMWAMRRPDGGSEFGFSLPFYDEDGGRDARLQNGGQGIAGRVGSG